MIKKLSNTKFNRKTMIIIATIFILFILTFIFLTIFNRQGVNNSNNNGKLEGYAIDDDKAQETLLQPFNKSNIKFKVYGEISKGLNILGYTGKLYIQTVCSAPTLDDKTGKSVDAEKKSYGLSSEPVEIENHCVITTSDGILNSFDYSSPYDYENHHYLQRLYLTAYIELPDGSLISLFSYGHPSLQVNIYEKETRIVLEEGSAYFRIAKQNKDKVFTVQVGNKIFSTTEGAEFFATTTSIYTSSSSTKDLSNLVNEFITASKADKDWNKDVSSYISVYNGSFELIKGNGNLYDRESSNKEKMKKGKYEFLYRHVTVFDPGKTIKKGNVINVTPPSEKIFYSSIGYYEKTRGLWGTAEEVYDNLEYQLTLNNLNLNMDKIIKKEGNVSEIVTSYLAYHTEQVTKRVKEKEDARTAYIKKRQEQLKEEMKTCTDPNSYYVEEANGCCKNDYVYDSSINKCVTYGCAAGKYDVGGACCPIGTVLSKDGKYCVYPSNEKSTPTYYPKGSGGDTAWCVEFGTATAQLFCPAKQPRSNAYISNGKCCIKSDIKEPDLVPVQ